MPEHAKIGTCISTLASPTVHNMPKIVLPRRYMYSAHHARQKYARNGLSLRFLFSIADTGVLCANLGMFWHTAIFGIMCTVSIGTQVWYVPILACTGIMCTVLSIGIADCGRPCRNWWGLGSYGYGKG